LKQFFNTTGFCNPEDHYMVDPFRDIYDDILRRKAVFPHPCSPANGQDHLTALVGAPAESDVNLVAQAPKPSINLLQFPQGVYFVSAIVNGTIYKAEKLILQHH